MQHKLGVQTIPRVLLLQIVRVSLSTGSKHLARFVIAFCRGFVSDRVHAFVAEGDEVLQLRNSIAAPLAWRFKYSAESSLSSCLHCFVWCSISQFAIDHLHQYSYHILLS